MVYTIYSPIYNFVFTGSGVPDICESRSHAIIFEYLHIIYWEWFTQLYILQYSVS